MDGEIIDVRVRLCELRWDETADLGRPAADQRIYARIRSDHWVFTHDWSSNELPREGQFVELSPPSVRNNTSVTWDLGGVAVPADALLLITEEEGYAGVVESDGVVWLFVGDLPDEPGIVEDQRAREAPRRFLCVVKSVPYPANRAHAEVCVEPCDSANDDGVIASRKLPNQIKIWVKKTLTNAVIHRARGRVSPVAIHPNDRPTFVNAEL